MKKLYIVYKIINQINGKCYIGKHETFNINDSYFGSGKILKLAIKKYGRDNFIKEIIEYCNSSIELCEKEIFLIKENNSLYPNGYNINNGGKGGDNFTNNPNRDLILQKIKNRPIRLHTIEEKEDRRKRMTGTKLKPHKKINCEYCTKEISQANYNRWHGDNCKSSPNYIKKELKKKQCEYCTNIVFNHIYSQYHGIYCKSNPNRVLKDFTYKSNSKESTKNGWIKRRLNKKDKNSEESNMKRSQKLKGRVVSKKTREKMSKAMTKRWQDKKLGDSCRDRTDDNPF